MTKKLGYFARLLQATRYSLQGIRAAYRHEGAFRQEVWLAVVFIAVGYFILIWTGKIYLIIAA